ncbi:hypothetical protein E1281_32360 [Actinomadura sp. KC345]|uniref:hypothetical protein n=1 Tax=Actinomadura sp. KC345 TaxID=2530371 RepID=UPI00104622CD|nr:hypothetical protein [Actinomadura sp. KC345]TDC44855.1 hypothetical protein E1281_32360 [Actinomadura sp. KC345]
MKRAILRVTLASGVVLSPMIAAGPAAAGVWGPWRNYGSYGSMCIHSFANCKAEVTFHPNGDVVHLRDKPGDDYSVRLRIKNVTKDPDATEYSITAHNGTTSVFPDGQPENLAEKHCFRFTIWLLKYGAQAGHKHYTQVRNYNNDGPKFCHDVA